MSPNLAATAVCDFADLAGLEPEWWDLWRRSPATGPFQSPGWVLSWWRAFHPGEPLAVAVRLGGRLVGLAPFYIDRGQPGTRLLPLGIGITDYVDILVDPAVRRPVLASIARAYASWSPPWLEWELPDLAPSANALELPMPAGCEASEVRGETCPVLVLPRAQAEPDRLAFLPPRMRRKVRMTGNRIARHGAARFLHTHERPAAWWLGELKRLHGARWASRGEAGVLTDPRLEAFHLEVIEALMGRGLMRLHALLLGGVTAAVYYGFASGKQACAYLGGFDPSFAYYSPGTALIGRVIEEAIGEGREELHFLRGGESYKYAWGADDRWNTRRVIRRRRA